MSRIRAFFGNRISNVETSTRSLAAALRGLVVVITATVAATSAEAQSLSVYERVRYDLSSTASSTNAAYIGSNPSAVAWDGTQLYVAGLNGSGATQNTGLTQVQSATAGLGFVAPTLATAFGIRSTPGSRGYSGIALKDGVLASAYDDGSNAPNPISAFVTTGTAANTPLWNTGTASVTPVNNRGFGGVAFDPGYNADPAQGSGVAWLTTGAGRRMLQDVVTGSSIYTTASGMIINTGSGGTNWRDIDFDPDNGNLYTRRANDVTYAIRSGSNSVSSTGWIVNNNANAASTPGQNLSFMNNATDPAGTFSGDAIIYNDRSSTATGQAFASVVKMVTITDGTSGTAIGTNWNFLSGNSYSSGNGYYDFDYDPKTKTLAVLDYANRNVSVFDLDVVVRSVASGTETAALIAGTKPLAKQGAGTLVVDQAGAAAAGTIYVQQGTLQIGNGGTTGSAGSPLAITVSSGATLAFNRSDDYGGGFANAIGGAGGIEVKSGLLAVAASNSYTGGTVISGGTLSIGAGGSVGSVPGNITNNGALLFNRSVALTYSGVISGSGSLGKQNGGTFTLTGSNTYTGPTTVSAGTLVLGTNGSIANSSLVQVGSGATLNVTQKAGGYTVPSGQTLGGNGTVSGTVSIGTGATLSPGASPGTLTITGGATLGAGGNYNWQILNATGTAGAATGWDLLSVGGVLDVASTSADPFKINLWSLSSTGPDVNGNALNWNSTSSGTWRIASASGGITNFAADKFLINVSATNGTGGFTNSLSGGTFSLAQSGNDLNLVFTAGAGPTVITINVASGTQTQTQAGYPLLSGTTPVEKIGLGTVVVDQANTLTGPTTVSQGRLELATANALSASAVTVAAGATLSVGPQVSAVVPTLVNNGLVDVAFGELTVVSGLTAEGLKTQIVAGRNEGAWDGATGITSSGAAGTADRAVGWIDNGDGSFRFGYAAAGDLDMNGLVDLDDVIAFVGGGLYDTGSPAVWAQGDYDYNGIVDLDDVIAFVGGGLYDKGPYNQPAGGLSLMGFGGGEDLGLMNGGFTAVPEPATWVLAALGAACAAGWRRRTPPR